MWTYLLYYIDGSVPTPTRFLAECGEYSSLFTPSLGNFPEVNPFEYSFQTQKNLPVPTTPGTNSFKSSDPQPSLRYLAITNMASSQQAAPTVTRNDVSAEYPVKIEPADDPKNEKDYEKLQKQKQKIHDKLQKQSQHPQEPEISPSLSAASPPSPKPSQLPNTLGTSADNSIAAADQERDTTRRATSEDYNVRESSPKEDDEIRTESSSPRDDFGEKRAKRRRDSYRSGDDSDSSSGSYDKKRKHSDDNEDDSEEKRRRFLERNRMAGMFTTPFFSVVTIFSYPFLELQTKIFHDAHSHPIMYPLYLSASKCRQKKKAWMQELESRSDEITNRNKALHMLVANLKEEVLMLKDQLLAHRGCGCNVIQQYVRTSGHFNMSLMNAMVNNALASGPELDMMVPPQQQQAPPPPQPQPQHMQQQQMQQQHHRQQPHHIPHSYPMQQQSLPYEQHAHVMQAHPMTTHPHIMQQQMMAQPAMFSQ